MPRAAHLAKLESLERDRDRYRDALYHLLTQLGRAVDESELLAGLGSRAPEAERLQTRRKPHRKSA